MIYSVDSIISDIANFADLGTSEVVATETDRGFYTQLSRNGDAIKLTFRKDGTVVEEIGGETRQHTSFRALLASSNFADLARWADSQQLLLRPRVSQETIPVTGHISKTGAVGDVAFLDKALASPTGERPRVQVTLINGPAGIGKTSLLRALALRRAEGFRRRQLPLLLHVESRGRMLQNLTDLMAFSLQTLRVPVTYDQVPVLVRHGLVVLAIDGFDELGDPSGYDLAWAQVNELVVESRGSGSVILSGRETFIAEDRIIKAISALNLSTDEVITFNLRYINPSIAKTWLAAKGWTTADFESELTAPIFEQGSYALRPFFLTELARDGVRDQIQSGAIADLLTFLVAATTRREATKFGRDIEAVSTSLDREKFTDLLMEEVSRDLAENQSASLSSDNLTWLAEAVAASIFPETLWGMLKNRAGVIAFLTDDDRRGYKRFIHDSIYSYFLSRVTVRSIGNGELAKYIRRNIFGLEFLQSFVDVARLTDDVSMERFISSAGSLLKSVGNTDRTKGNLATLLIAVAGVVPLDGKVVIEDASVDEALVLETASITELRRVTIGQMFARGANLSQIEFDTCFVSTLIADHSTIVSGTMPPPSVLNLPDRTVTEPAEIHRWMFEHTPDAAQKEFNLSIPLRDFGLFPLFGRLIRYKPFWLKMGDERVARRILGDPHWEQLKKLMMKHDLLVERYDVPASGPKEAFYHVRKRAMLLGQETSSKQVEKFLNELLLESFELEGGADRAAEKLVTAGLAASRTK